MSGPTTTVWAHSRVGRKKEREREGRRNEWPYETFSITKSNTANVARRRKNRRRGCGSQGTPAARFFARPPARPADTFPGKAARRRGGRPSIYGNDVTPVYSWHLVRANVSQGDPRIEFSFFRAPRG